MTLTYAEEKRLKKVEETATATAHLVKGTASKNMLNRLLVLCQEETKSLTEKINELEEEMSTILELTRKLQ